MKSFKLMQDRSRDSIGSPRRSAMNIDKKDGELNSARRNLNPNKSIMVMKKVDLMDAGRDEPISGL